MSSSTKLDLNKNLNALCCMGFQRDVCYAALLQTDGDIERALNLLTSMSGPSTDQALLSQQQRDQGRGYSSAYSNGVRSNYAKSRPAHSRPPPPSCGKGCSGTSKDGRTHQQQYGCFRDFLSSINNGLHHNTKTNIRPAPLRLLPRTVLGSDRFENGREASTCVALRAAEAILTMTGTQKYGNHHIETVITTIFLHNVVNEGMAVYSFLKEKNPDMKHTWAKEVLASGCFPVLKQQGEVQHGILSQNAEDPRGLHSLLRASQDDHEWTCVLITKPPETVNTVLVVLPPTAGRNGNRNGRTQGFESESLEFVLVDSLPRPHQFRSQASYARMHATLRDLVHNSLEQIFPPIDFGRDVTVLMASAHNQFDLTRFRKKRQLDLEFCGENKIIGTLSHEEVSAEEERSNLNFYATSTAESFSVKQAPSQQQVGNRTDSLSTNYNVVQSPVRPGPQMVCGPISQYSIENGRSASTCIAFASGEEILTRIRAAQYHNQNNNDIGTIITDTFLRHVFTRGVDVYSKLKAKNLLTEHSSAEEVIMSGFFPALNQQGDVQQGMLSHDPEHHLGLHSLLQASQDALEWTCVVITKPPETVLVVLPPTVARNEGDQESESFNFTLVDSHPRMHEFGTQEGYARMHTTLRGLVHDSLEQIFPYTDLGPDIPPLMAAMYNQCDLTIFRGMKQLDLDPGSNLDISPTVQQTLSCQNTTQSKDTTQGKNTTQREHTTKIIKKTKKIPPSSRTVSSSISEDSIENGRSACTCIALCAGEKILARTRAQETGNQSNNDFEKMITTAFLRKVIAEGVEINKKLTAMHRSTAKEVFKSGYFQSLSEQGQGTSEDPAWLRSLLRACQDEHEWTCVLISKLAETVLVVLPPNGDKNVRGEDLASGSYIFLLVDPPSQPSEPSEFGCALMQTHTSLRDLVRHSLKQIFPCSDVGPDNRFDLICFRGKQQLNQDPDQDPSSHLDIDPMGQPSSRSPGRERHTTFSRENEVKDTRIDKTALMEEEWRKDKDVAISASQTTRAQHL